MIGISGGCDHVYLTLLPNALGLVGTLALGGLGVGHILSMQAETGRGPDKIKVGPDATRDPRAH